MPSPLPRLRSPGWLCILLGLAAAVDGPARAAAADPLAIERGAVIYRQGTCPVCHHWQGQGNRRGPDLTDDEWLHGDGSLTAVRQAIETGFRHGAGRRFRGKYEMWPFGGMELDEPDVDALTAYVWSLHRRRRAADTLTREVVSRIAFGSGADQDRSQPVWDTVLALRPQLMLMLGNSVLADTDDMDQLRLQYDKLAAKPASPSCADRAASWPPGTTWTSATRTVAPISDNAPSRSRCSWTSGGFLPDRHGAGNRASTRRSASDRRDVASRSSCSIPATTADRCGAFHPTRPRTAKRAAWVPTCPTTTNARGCWARNSGVGSRSSSVSRPTCA